MTTTPGLTLFVTFLKNCDKLCVTACVVIVTATTLAFKSLPLPPGLLLKDGPRHSGRGLCHHAVALSALFPCAPRVDAGAALSSSKGPGNKLRAEGNAR